jgi:hypothetical protein
VDAILMQWLLLDWLARMAGVIVIVALIVAIVFAAAVQMDVAGRAWSLLGRYLRWRKGK